MFSEASKQIMRQKALARDNSNRISSLPRGKNHWNYSSNPSKVAIHKRLYKKFGSASTHKCSDCENRAHDWSNETGVYSDDIKDYKPRCRSCHVKKDKNWIKK